MKHYLELIVKVIQDSQQFLYSSRRTVKAQTTFKDPHDYTGPTYDI